jgi:hypothetical protein
MFLVACLSEEAFDVNDAMTTLPDWLDIAKLIAG